MRRHTFVVAMLAAALASGCRGAPAAQSEVTASASTAPAGMVTVPPESSPAVGRWQSADRDTTITLHRDGSAELGVTGERPGGALFFATPVSRKARWSHAGDEIVVKAEDSGDCLVVAMRGDRLTVVEAMWSSGIKEKPTDYVLDRVG